MLKILESEREELHSFYHEEKLSKNTVVSLDDAQQVAYNSKSEHKHNSLHLLSHEFTDTADWSVFGISHCASMLAVSMLVAALQAVSGKQQLPLPVTTI